VYNGERRTVNGSPCFLPPGTFYLLAKVLKTVGSHFLCLLAAFQLLGGHWLVLQTAAWVQMVAHYSSSDGLEAAFSKTFDGRHPCDLCNKIAQKKAAEKKQFVQLAFGKTNLLAQENFLTLHPPAVFWQLSGTEEAFCKSSHKPQVPPPRKLIA
jgi:hypothetical protein